MCNCSCHDATIPVNYLIKTRSVLCEQWEAIFSHYGQCIWLSVNAVYP
jgi:hypothetical protein